ncbi:hypothetical protein LJR231_001544 [Phyllobacterium sp. LjRoot231]|uniref:hypothetical protein n=1 Tax=Phyllobacterium sp. LjRoot231 TaxID=3342289 RepID=UPI003ECEB9BA
MNDPISIAQQGYTTWAAKPHNAKWVRKIDGTPIPNDLVVCIAMAFAAHITSQEWRCFHCEEVFTDPAAARDHFGSHEVCEPICCMSAADVREMEREIERYRAEDSDKDREMHGMRADHARALINEEEKGYGRGLADGRALSQPHAQASEPCIVCDGTGSVLDGTHICLECNGSGKHDDRPGGFDGPTGAD